MLNGFYDFKNKTAFTPYLMGGVGLASIDETAIRHITDELNDAYTNEVLGNGYVKLKKKHTTNNFSWNTGAGVRYKMNNDFSLDFSYQYLDAGKSSFTTYTGSSPLISNPNNNGYERTKAKITQDFMLGLTYIF